MCRLEKITQVRPAEEKTASSFQNFWSKYKVLISIYLWSRQIWQKLVFRK